MQKMNDSPCNDCGCSSEAIARAGGRCPLPVLRDQSANDKDFPSGARLFWPITLAGCTLWVLAADLLFFWFFKG